jgi:hypothetical protein
MEKADNWKVKTIIFGVIFGCIAGAIGSYIIIQRAENTKAQPKISASEGVKLGLGVLSVLRMISDSGGGK